MTDKVSLPRRRPDQMPRPVGTFANARVAHEVVARQGLTIQRNPAVDLVPLQAVLADKQMKPMLAVAGKVRKSKILLTVLRYGERGEHTQYDCKQDSFRFHDSLGLALCVNY